jgi:hypothetical protein
MPELVKLLDGPAVSYGKGAIVGVAGEMEHGPCVRTSDARETHAGGNRRRKGGNRIECQGGRCGCSARRAARAQRRFLVIPAFRHGLGRRCTATR